MVDYVGKEAALSVTALANDLQRASKTPLVELYNVAHSFVVRLAIGIVQRQALSIRGQQRSAVSLGKVEYVKEPPSLSLRYWLIPGREAADIDAMEINDTDFE